MLWYVRELEDGEEDSLLIGVYRSEDDAKAAIERLESKRGFVDDPNGFQVHECRLNRDHWTEGFIID